MDGALSEFEFSYRLTGTGWSEARIAIGTEWVMLRASYLSDALGDLLKAVEQLNSGAPSARVSWEEEPGEHRWLLDRDRDAVEARLLWFDDQDEELPDEKGRERSEGESGWECSLRRSWLRRRRC